MWIRTGIWYADFILLGETNIARRRIEPARKVSLLLQDVARGEGADLKNTLVEVSERCVHLSQVGKSVNGFVSFDAPMGSCLQLAALSACGIGYEYAYVTSAPPHGVCAYLSPRSARRAYRCIEVGAYLLGRSACEYLEHC